METPSVVLAARVPDDLRQRLKQRALNERISVQEAVTRAVTAYLVSESSDTASAA